MRRFHVLALATLATIALASACNERPTETAGEQRQLAYAAKAAAPGVMTRLARAKPATVGASAAEADAAPPDAPTAAPTPAFDSTAKLIRTASAAVEVKALDPAMASARLSASRFGGTVANATIETGRNEIHRAVLRIRVPAARFDSLLEGLAPLGRVESVQVNAEDVGEEWVDIEARLANLRRLETRLVELLANRTGKLSDVLSVERELARVRGEIEQIEGRRRYLQRSIALSTLELTLHEPDPIVAGTPGTNPIVVALKNGWRYLVAAFAWSITALVVVVPVGAVVVGVALAGRWVARRAQLIS